MIWPHLHLLWHFQWAPIASGQTLEAHKDHINQGGSVRVVSSGFYNGQHLLVSPDLKQVCLKQNPRINAVKVTRTPYQEWVSLGWGDSKHLYVAEDPEW